MPGGRQRQGRGGFKVGEEVQTPQSVSPRNSSWGLEVPKLSKNSSLPFPLCSVVALPYTPLLLSLAAPGVGAEARVGRALELL